MSEQLFVIGGLILAGYLLLAVELLVLPGFGVAGLSGMVCFTVGCILAFRWYGPLQGSATVGLVVITVTALLAWFPRSKAGRGVIQSESLASAHSVDSKLVVGDEGVAESDLRPSGVARFGELRESVVTDGEFLSVGVRVRVAEIEGARVVVEKIAQVAGELAG